MSEPILLLVEFDGAVFRPVNPRIRDRCAEIFETGEVYRVEIKDHRSAVSHNAFFASIARAWRNLPDDLAKHFPTAEHFRKWLLVQNGFADLDEIPCDTEDDAIRQIASVRKRDGYAVIKRYGSLVRIWTAQSMAAKQMPRKTFEIAKALVLAQAAEMIGVTVAELTARPSDEPDHAHEQPNPIDTTEHPASDVVGKPDESPAVVEPGSSTPQSDATSPGASAQQERPEQTALPTNGGTPLPSTFAEYEYHLKAWLGFTASRKRIKMKYLKEQTDIWPKMVMPLSDDQILYFDKLMMDRVKELPEGS